MLIALRYVVGFYGDSTVNCFLSRNKINSLFTVRGLSSDGGTDYCYSGINGTVLTSGSSDPAGTLVFGY